MNDFLEDHNKAPTKECQTTYEILKFLRAFIPYVHDAIEDMDRAAEDDRNSLGSVLYEGIKSIPDISLQLAELSDIKDDIHTLAEATSDVANQFQKLNENLEVFIYNVSQSTVPCRVDGNGHREGPKRAKRKPKLQLEEFGEW